MDIRISGHRLKSIDAVRGRGGPGGWVKKARCVCGVSTWAATTEDLAHKYFEAHVREETATTLRGMLMVFHRYPNQGSSWPMLMMHGPWEFRRTLG